MTNILISAVGALLCILGFESRAASFDCAKAKSGVETLICMDYRLAELDEQLASIYNAIRGEDAARTSAQKEWVRRRNQCQQFWCVVDIYVSRIKVLAPETVPAFDREATPATLPWQYLPPHGAEFELRVERAANGDPLLETYQRIPPYENVGWNLRTDRQEPLPNMWSFDGPAVDDYVVIRESPLWKNRIPIELGASKLESVNDIYSFCGVPIHDTGLTFLRTDRASRPRRIQILELRSTPNFVRQGSRCTNEENDFEVHVMPKEPLYDFIWQKQYYARYQSYILRFDGRMTTYSSLVGKHIFIPDGEDLDRLIVRQCGRPTDERVGVQCVDERLGRLIDQVRHYY